MENESISKPKSDKPNKSVEALTIDYKNNTITISKTLTRDENDKTIMGDTTKTENSKRTIFMNNKVKSILKQAQKRLMTNINGLLFYDNEKNTNNT